MDYSQPFFIDQPVGNNALSFEKRGEHPRLWVPSLVEGTLDDLKLGTEVVFEDIDEFDVLQSCAGLEHLVSMELKGIPAVLVDNHNHVFYFWWKAFFEGVIEKGASLVHIDQHKDMRVPECLFDGANLEEVFDYTNFHLNVGNYIVPAREAGLVGEIQFVTSELSMEDLSFVPKKNKILNIDLDFFAPELSYIDFEKSKAFIAAHLPTTSLITIATSPFFIDQNRALEVLRKLFA